MKLNSAQKKVIGCGLFLFVLFAFVQPHQTDGGIAFGWLPTYPSWPLLVLVLCVIFVATLTLALLTKSSDDLRP